MWKSVFLKVQLPAQLHGNHLSSLLKMQISGPHLTFTKPEPLGVRSRNICEDFYRSTLVSLQLQVLEKHYPWNLGELASKFPLRPLFQFQIWFDPWQVVWENREFSRMDLHPSPKVFCSVKYCLCFNNHPISVFTYLAEH